MFLAYIFKHSDWKKPRGRRSKCPWFPQRLQAYFAKCSLKNLNRSRNREKSFSGLSHWSQNFRMDFRDPARKRIDFLSSQYATRNRRGLLHWWCAQLLRIAIKHRLNSGLPVILLQFIITIFCTHRNASIAMNQTLCLPSVYVVYWAGVFNTHANGTFSLFRIVVTPTKGFEKPCSSLRSSPVLLPPKRHNHPWSGIMPPGPWLPFGLFLVGEARSCFANPSWSKLITWSNHCSHWVLKQVVH